MDGALQQNIHATCVALPVGGTWHGVLLRGPSGAGKSDLAIRILEAGGRLIADDRTRLSADAGRLVARAPANLAGLIEVRGLGVLRLPPKEVLAAAPVMLIVDLVDAAVVERMPEAGVESLLGVDVPRVQLAAFEASTSAKIRLALTATRVT
ncbi:MAG: serine/threonine protein kinase [Alphaproteobacteria bacterium]|nr:serine/threonine protein kinase [Alphaproteobacteria bacterium]